MTEDPQDVSGAVMFCVRVAPLLRRRVKLAAVSSGRTIQQLTIESLEEMCRRPRRVGMHACLLAEPASSPTWRVHA